MISFKNFLTESRSAPLYHATSLNNYLQIIGGGLEPKTQHRKYTFDRPVEHDKDYTKDVMTNGISLSRDFKFAHRWAFRQPVSQKGGIIIQLDQRKLSQRYRIRPIDFWGGTDQFKEAEEFLEFKGKINLLPYITKIYYKFDSQLPYIDMLGIPLEKMK